MAHTAQRRLGRTRRVAGCALLLGLVAAACAPPPTLTPQQQVDQIVAFVQAARGHAFTTPPVVEFLDPAAFEAEVLADLDAAEADVDADDVAFTALDWITPAQDLFTEYRKAFGTGVVGFYDPADESLKVRGTTLTPYRREVIAHELTHALDDQVFDLGDITSSGLLDEQYISALVAIEGSASKVQQRYFDSMSALDRVADIGEQLAAGNDPTLLTVPVTLLTITTAPYLRGATFQQQLIGALGNPAGPDLSLARYPANTEQAFDTDSYLADEAAAAVPTPPTEGAATPVRSGELGPFAMSLVLREGLVLDALDPATAGWAGGSYVTWRSGAQSCIRADTVMDSGAEADALEAGLTDWTGRHPGGLVERTSPETVRLTRCDG